MYMSNKEKVIVVLLVLALIFSFVSLTLQFVTPSGQNINSSGNVPAGQVNLFVQKNAVGQTASPEGTG